MDTTKEPDTEYAGMLQKLFLNIIVFIFIPVKLWQTKNLSAADHRREVWFSISYTASLNNNQPYRNR